MNCKSTIIAASAALALAATAAFADRSANNAQVWNDDWSDAGKVAVGTYDGASGVVTNGYTGDVSVGNNFILLY